MSVAYEDNTDKESATAWNWKHFFNDNWCVTFLSSFIINTFLFSGNCTFDWKFRHSYRQDCSKRFPIWCPTHDIECFRNEFTSTPGLLSSISFFIHVLWYRSGMIFIRIELNSLSCSPYCFSVSDSQCHRLDFLWTIAVFLPCLKLDSWYRSLLTLIHRVLHSKPFQKWWTI